MAGACKDPRSSRPGSASANGFANETGRDGGDNARHRRRPARPSPGQRDARNAGDRGDVRRSAHNPEVEGSNPSPATKARGRFRTRNRPLSIGLCTIKCPATTRHDSPTPMTSWPAGLAFDVLPDLVILLTMTVLPLGDVKSHLSELVSRVHDYHERVTVTVHGRPSAVLIAPEDLERLEETLEIMRDAATMNRLAESDAELARGEHVSAGELAEAMRQRRAR